MGLRPFLPLAVLPVLLLLTLGCGLLPGGDAEAGELGLIDFGDDPEFTDESAPPPSLEEAVDRALYIDPLVLIEIRFLFNFQVRLERLRRVVRDLNGVLEYSAPADVDLDWVVEVHEVTRESDDYFLALTSMELPDSQRDQYGYLHIGTLEVVQVAALGSDRLLAAAVLVGPSGRSLLNMSG